MFDTTSFQKMALGKGVKKQGKLVVFVEEYQVLYVIGNMLENRRERRVEFIYVVTKLVG